MWLVSGFELSLLFECFKRLSLVVTQGCDTVLKLDSKYGFGLYSRTCFKSKVLCMKLSMVYTCYKAWHVALEKWFCIDAYENSEVIVLQALHWQVMWFLKC